MLSVRKTLCAAVVLLLLLPVRVGALDDYILTEDDKKIATPKAYTPAREIKYLGEEYGGMLSPSELFLGPDDKLYVCDSGNNRILKMDLEGRVLEVFSDGAGKPFSDPQGVFVTKNGAIFVGDTGNKRIVHLSSKGEAVSVYEEPTASFELHNEPFIPTRIAVSNTGYIYTIRRQSLLMISPANVIEAFVGTPEVGFSFKQLLLRVFASKEQRDKLAKPQPASYLSFEITENDIIYAASEDAKFGQLKRINSVGKNTYPQKFYGVTEYNGAIPVLPKFTDLTVGGKGIISAIEENSRCIYQYDQSGNLLCIFGGRADRTGKFDLPVAIESDSEGNLYILDKNAGNIQVMRPTEYIRQIHGALREYEEGNYDSSLAHWRSVLLMNSNFDLAYEGVARIYLKRKDYGAAMEYSRLSSSKELYGTAFEKNRHEVYREHFIAAALLSAAAAVLVLFLIFRLKRSSDGVVRRLMFAERGE